MMATPKPGSDHSRRTAGGFDEASSGDPDKGCHHRQQALKESKTVGSDCFVAINICNLSLLKNTNDKDSTTNPRVQKLQKSLSRTGSQRGGGERMAAEKDTTAGESGACEKTSLLVHVAVAEEFSIMSRETTSTVARRGRVERWRSVGRRRSPWLHPRTVLMLFATLSSMGTLVLLYFTIYMGTMASGMPTLDDSLLGT